MKKIFLPIKIRAKVVAGAGRGKKLGVPTINLDPTKAVNLPEGIWAAKVYLPKVYIGVLHFGPRPTFNEDNKSLEVYLLDFNDHLPIPPELEVEIMSFIREIIKFKTVRAMLKKIEEDIKIARKLALRY